VRPCGISDADDIHARGDVCCHPRNELFCRDDLKRQPFAGAGEHRITTLGRTWVDADISSSGHGKDR
jgi:hypothetical protein